MNRKISVIAVGGILTAAICLPLAALVYPRGPQSWEWASQSHNWFGGRGGGPIVSRELPWDGTDRLELDILGDLSFHHADAWHLVVRGPEHTLDHLTTSAGRIRINRSSFFHWGGSERLSIDLSGPALQEIVVNGSGSVTLNDVAQDFLDVRINGSGSAKVQGSVKSLRLRIGGSGSAHLEHLVADDADVHIGGSGIAEIAPTNSANITIGGSGEVRLRTSPRHLNSHVGGSGRVVDLSAAAP